MTATNLHVEFASEAYSATGPLHIFREVVEAVVTDHGGNVLAGPGPVEKIAARKFRVPTRITPTILGGEVASADMLIGCHIVGE